MNAAETHETIHWKSGMRYQVSSRLDFERESGCSMHPRTLVRTLTGRVIHS
jgi:hypothetical protein